MESQHGILRLQLVDVYEKPLAEPVDILLRHQVLAHSSVVRGINAVKKITIRDLYGSPQGLYRVAVDPPSYLPISEFVNVADGPAGTERKLVFPIDPQKVNKVDFPNYDSLSDDLRRVLTGSDMMTGFEGKRGEDLYAALDNLRRAGLLNIGAKCGHTRLSNSRTVASYVTKINEIRGDRFFANVSHELREDVVNSLAEGIFHEVSELMHHPPASFAAAGSYKTPDHYGNLQLSFFTNGSEWVADIDIDDANGLEHVFQVLRNELSGRPTHPYDIHEILVFHQDLDPGYRFIFS